jgi:hypothetical protein
LLNLDVDENYTASQRRRHAGHGSDDVYDRYYAQTNPGTDGQGTYVGDTPRTLLPKLLRILKMNHPELAQTLPARELHELVTSNEYSSIVIELDSLQDADDAASKKARSDLLLRLRNLKLAALKKYREEQRDNLFRMAKTEDVGHCRRKEMGHSGMGRSRRNRLRDGSPRPTLQNVVSCECEKDKTDERDEPEQSFDDQSTCLRHWPNQYITERQETRTSCRRQKECGGWESWEQSYGEKTMRERLAKALTLRCQL